MDAMDKSSHQRDRRTDASALDGIPASDGTGKDNGFGALIAKKVQARTKGKRVRLTGSRN
jgi:hypothetical protein